MIFVTPDITVESFRTERSARVRNDSGRSVFLTRYETSIELPVVENDSRIPKIRTARTFDLVEKEIPPGRSVQIETRGLETRRAERLDSKGGVNPVPSIGLDQFPYVNHYRDIGVGGFGRILFYSDDDPELLSRVSVDGSREALPSGVCAIYYSVEFSRLERKKSFDCRAVAGLIGELDSALKGYHLWKNAKQEAFE